MYINFVMRLNNKMGLMYKISALILNRQFGCFSLPEEKLWTLDSVSSLYRVLAQGCSRNSIFATKKMAVTMKNGSNRMGPMNNAFRKLTR